MLRRVNRLDDRSFTSHPKGVNAMWRYYGWPSIAAICVLGYLAYAMPHSAMVVAMLAVLEVALSFDNASVNATYVAKLNKKWQKRFMLWGIAVAVFGVRGAVPIVIVAIGNHESIGSALTSIVKHPDAFTQQLLNAHLPVMVFGSVYLLQIFATFLFAKDHETDAEGKDLTIYWIGPVERWFERLGGAHPHLSVLAVACGAIIGLCLKWHQQYRTVIGAGLVSIVLYTALSLLTRWLNARQDRTSDRPTKQRGTPSDPGLNGLLAFAMFCYLEVQDATFSVDSVMGGLSMIDRVQSSIKLILLLLGLGIGALFVRGMTLHLVATNAFLRYPYLGHGTFWAIGTLPWAMWFDLSSLVIGCITTSLIGLAWLHSLFAKKRFAQPIGATGETLHAK